MFNKYKNTIYAKNLLPVIPPHAELSTSSKISPKLLGKIPGQRNRYGTWTGFADWNNHLSTDTELKRWSGWECNVSINCRDFLVGIDVDFEDTDIQDLIYAEVQTHFGEMVYRGRSDSARCLYVGLQLELINKQALKFANTETGELCGIDILGKGSQFLIHGTHPKGGQYQWPSGDLYEYGAEDLVGVSTYALEQFLKHIIDVLSRHNWQLVSGKSQSQAQAHDYEVVDRKASNITLEQLQMLDLSTKELIRNGVPQGGDRSRVLSSLVMALISLGLDDNNIADILMNPDYGISQKPLEKGIDWLMQDIARLRAKFGSPEVEQASTGESVASPSAADGDDTDSPVLDDEAAIEQAISEAETTIQIEAVLLRISRFQNRISVERLLRLLKQKSGLSITALRRSVRDIRAGNAGGGGGGGEGDDGGGVGEALSHHALAQLFSRHVTKSGQQAVFSRGITYFTDVKTQLWIAYTDAELQLLMRETIPAQPNYMRMGDYRAVAEGFQHMMADNGFFDSRTPGFAGPDYILHIPGEGSRPITVDDRIHWIANAAPEMRPEMRECPMWMAFLERTFAGEDYEGQVTLLQELIGGALGGLLPEIQIASMFYGEGQTGKSTVLEVMSGIFPRKFVCAVPPHEWGNEYYVAHMCNMILNLCGEVDAERAIAGDSFKRFIDRLAVVGRAPGGVPFEYIPALSHFFNVNQFPYTKDKTNAFLRRWAIVEFANKLADNEVDPRFAQNMIKAELPAILSWALVGMERVKRNKGVSQSKTSLRLREEWLGVSNNALMFLNDSDVLVPSFAQKIRLGDVYTVYKAWCKQSNYRAFGKHNFYQIVRNRNEVYSRDRVEFLVEMNFGEDVFSHLGLSGTELHAATSWDSLKNTGESR